MEQTATDWMFDQLWETPKDKLAWFKILMDAKEMEKEQIRTAFVVGKWDGKDRDIDSENYYKETYEKK